MPTLSDILTDALFLDALTAGLFLSATCALLGFFVVARRIVFVAMTVTQAASAGIAANFLVAHGVAGALAGGAVAGLWESWGADICSLVFVLFTVLVLARAEQVTRLSEEAIVGFCYALLGGVSMLFVAQQGEGMAELRQLVQGDVLFITRSHVWLLGGASVGTWLFIAYAWRPLVFISFDRETAAACGFNLKLWDTLFYVLLGLAVSLSIRFAGLLLVFAYLVAPAAGGLLLGRSCIQSAALGVAVAVTGTASGLVMAFRWDSPASPLIVVAVCSLAGLCALLGWRLRW